ncbi:hypothetical protein DYH09_11000, partial [bacterium CPR1]|nr:hypothetical protein [bacterium CPR1]
SQTETNPLRSYYVFLIVFVLLAALTIAVSLFFMHSAVVSFDGVFARSDDITRAQVMLENVSRLLLEVNAAGNDIFETRDLPRETARFRQASAQLRRALADAPTAHFSRAGFEAHFDEMLRAEERIFSLFSEILDPAGTTRPEQEILGEAAARMAEMDRAQLHAMSVLREAANALIREHQVIQDEGRRVLNERWWRELVVLTFVTVSLGSGWFLWRQLQQVHEHFVREQQRVQEERRNRLASVGEVCFSVAHGIKNPVAAIASSAQLVLEYGHLDDASRQRIADLLTSTRSLSARVTQLLNFSRVGPTHRERFTPKDVFTWSLRELEPTLVDQGIRVLREDDDNAAILEGDLRIRAEIWDWFAPVPPLEDDYTFGHGRLRARLGYRNPGSFEGLVELQGVQLVGLPDNAIGPAPIGQMGPGAILYNHAGQSDFSSLGVRQAYLKLGDPQSFQAQLGRMDFGNAAEVMPKEPSLAWLKRARLKDRLIGTFDFSPFARSFDGLRLDGDTGDLHLTGFVAMPTQGGFEPGFSTTIDNYLISDLSITLKQGGLLEDGEAQLFWVHSDDQRPVPQVDNRPLALRGQVRAEGGDQIDTLGGHFIHKLGENGDALVWYAHQTGSWGQQRHVADAFSAELGYKFKQTGWEPWVRGGFSYYSGDSNPLDNVHGTFIAPLPTIRVYALTPFYSESNLQDLFLQLMLKPGPQTAARLELHNLRLAQAADLWYVGAGATR